MTILVRPLCLGILPSRDLVSSFRTRTTSPHASCEGMLLGVQRSVVVPPSFPTVLLHAQLGPPLGPVCKVIWLRFEAPPLSPTSASASASATPTAVGEHSFSGGPPRCVDVHLSDVPLAAGTRKPRGREPVSLPEFSSVLVGSRHAQADLLSRRSPHVAGFDVDLQHHNADLLACLQDLADVLDPPLLAGANLRYVHQS